MLHLLTLRANERRAPRQKASFRQGLLRIFGDSGWAAEEWVKAVCALLRPFEEIDSRGKLLVVLAVDRVNDQPAAAATLPGDIFHLPLDDIVTDAEIERWAERLGEEIKDPARARRWCEDLQLALRDKATRSYKVAQAELVKVLQTEMIHAG